jgi:hypothetical protein
VVRGTAAFTHVSRVWQSGDVQEVPYLNDKERLVGNIREELQAQRAMRVVDLSDQVVEDLAFAIALNIEYGFDVRWAPKWVGGVGHHDWIEDRNMPHPKYFVECLMHQRIAVHASEDEAADWWNAHVRDEHP